jgi:hypothetical protein
MEKVTVRNTTRVSLLVRVPGQSLHLPPGKTADVPRAYLQTDELATLLRRGAVALASPPPAAPAPAGKSAAKTTTAATTTAVATAAASEETTARQSRKR